MYFWSENSRNRLFICSQWITTENLDDFLSQSIATKCLTEWHDKLQILGITNFYERDFLDNYKVLDDILVYSDPVVIYL